MSLNPFATTEKVPDFAGIHHLKLPVTNLARGVEFYQKVFGAKHLPKLDHRHANGDVYSSILEVPNLGTLLEIRHDALAANAQAGFDLLTLAVPDRAALHAWTDHLDRLDVVHSPVLTGVTGWLLVFEDPDRHRIRFYTQETHDKTDEPSTDERWLNEN